MLLPMKSKRGILLVALLVGLLGGLTWLLLPPRDPLFRGKPESEWIKGIDYNGGEEQTKQWHEFGPEGVRVLIRGLEKANRPIERAYRRIYPRTAPRLPGVLYRLLPAPRTDSTRRTRMCVVNLLGRLGQDAKLATPALARTLKDENPFVRQIAITFFTHGEDENTLLNQLAEKERRKLLPDFIHAVEDKGDNWGLRNNAAIALKYYSEQREVVAPVLVKALKDPAPQVCWQPNRHTASLPTWS